MINPEDDQEKLRDFITQEFSTGSKNAIEAAIFLYLNKERPYPDREIFENVKENIKAKGITPERTFSTEVRKYTNNSPQTLKVSHTKLFTIKNLGETPQKFQLIEEVRIKVDEFFNEQEKESILHEVINVISSKGKTHKLGKTMNKKLEGVEFIFQGRGAYAILNYFDDKFILLKDSIVTNMHAEYFPTSFSGLFNLRKELIEKEILEKRTDGKYNLIKNLEFSSPSPCVCLCAGGSYNGFTAFKLKTNDQITLKEYVNKSVIKKQPKKELITPKKDKQQRIDDLHLKMILSTHILADAFRCQSFIGVIERSKSKELNKNCLEIPEWLKRASKQNEINDIQQIDNIWFYPKDLFRVIPFAVFEHERTGNLDAIARRLRTLHNVLKNTPEIQKLSLPLYIIVAPDNKKSIKYKKWIKNHSNAFNPIQLKDIDIIMWDDIKSRANSFLKLLTNQFKELISF